MSDHEEKVPVKEKTVNPKKKQKKEKKPKRGGAKKWLKRILVSLTVFVLLTIGGYLTVTHSAPYKKILDTTYDKLATMDKESFRKLTNTKIYDNKNEVIGEINTGNYAYIEISDIPLQMQNAYIAAEDQNFKHHQGVDYKSTLRAALALVKNRGEITQGGSTITQQVIKNNILSQEQSFMRKFMEILMAPDLEKKYSKQEIMEFYCNSNYYGNGCYGIESASKFYFGKPAKEMTLAECAMMAGISNSPNNYNPVTSMELATKKMKSILNKMLEQGFITEAEKKAALEQEIVITKTATEVKGSNNYMSSYAIHCTALELMKQDNFPFQYTFASEDEYKNYQTKYKEAYNEKSSIIRGGGFQIRTSFDMGIQKELQKAVDNRLSGNKTKQEDGRYQLQGAGVCIDNKTNYIVAMVGGRGEEDQFNRGFLATRQPGSAIKPLLVYGPAFDNGIISPATIYTDKKVGNANYSPKNAYNGYLGNMNIRKALALSTNTVAYQVFKDVGQEKALSYLDKMAFSGLRYADNTAVSISLGGFTNGTKVDEMAKAYAAIQHEGEWSEKNCIVKIEHERDGLLFEGGHAKTKEIFNADAAYMLTDTMQGVFNEEIGTGHYINLKGQIAAGKTGTTNSKRDVWFCGYTNYYTTAVWVGNDNNKRLSDTKYAGRIWEQFMGNIHKGKETSDFKVPSTIEYRNVKSNGNFGDSVYDKAKLNMGRKAYDRRPAGYDLSSGILKERLLDYQEEQERKQKLKNAENAVKVFEEYQIKDIESARGLDDLYSKTCAKVDEVSDPDKLSQLKTKVSVKYEKLKETYASWEKKIKEADAEAEAQKKEKQAEADERNQADAVKRLHEQRVSNMNRYIQLMQRRQYNTDAARNLISAAAGCLENCSGYPEYNDLKARYEKEVVRINGLPTEVPKPEIPENNHDHVPDEGDYPLEKVPDPEQSEENTSSEEQ